MKELLFGGGGLATLGIGLFRLIKWLKGRNPTIERVNEGMFRLTVDNKHTMYPMAQDGKVRNSPIKEDGIETFEIRDSNEVVESVTKDAVISMLRRSSSLSLTPHGFSIVSLAFAYRRTGDPVSLKDTDFQDRVDNNEVAAKNDVLVCDMRTMQWQTMQGQDRV